RSPPTTRLFPYTTLFRSKPIVIYDTTLRDGAQGPDVSFSAADKERIARLLDSLGFDYVEGGFPGSNPKDAELFAHLDAEPLALRSEEHTSELQSLRHLVC